VKPDRGQSDIITAWRRRPTLCGGTSIFSSRRDDSLAIGAMRAAGVDDLGYGDPIAWERTLK
jgi:hypothetical protein